MRVPVFDVHGKRTQEILEFDEKIFGDDVRLEVLKEAVLMYEARQRQGTHATKTRNAVAGSGRKLWRQKGTGRARTGPARAPHRAKGGRVFGPHPRDYSYSIPMQARRAAMDSAWLGKFQDKEVMVLDSFSINNEPKTSAVFETLSSMNVIGGRIVVGLPQHNDILWKSLRNIPKVSVEVLSSFHPHLILRNQHVILLRPAFEQLIKSKEGSIKSLSRKELYS